ncbi:hypothetical protein [Streptomyces ardesiacus]|uniref:hypothetical protein n=1 Tax=Streptomyces ardesiacus TaxID=285564 RepID=UPI000D599AF4|nr:hypothetical protein [Streptomyces ardesiacus]
MPMRTTLPRNLTRHFYETRRAFLQSAGQESTPWFQLSPLERSVVESEMEIFRQAIRRAEEEQDMLASLDATTAAAAVDEPAAEAPTDTPAAATQALEECDCPGCSAVAALLKLIGTVERVDRTVGVDFGDTDGQGVTPLTFTAVPLDTRRWGVPLTEEELTRLQNAMRNGGTPRLVTAGIDLDILDGTAPGSPLTFDSAPLSVDALFRKPSSFTDIRRDYWPKA